MSVSLQLLSVPPGVGDGDGEGEGLGRGLDDWKAGGTPVASMYLRSKRMNVRLSDFGNILGWISIMKGFLPPDPLVFEGRLVRADIGLLLFAPRYASFRTQWRNAALGTYGMSMG
jgi:hypothetical protein